ncbi:hypothetical protein NRB36_004316 [Salmonella enterica]|nr:hypothetical protein [Salmonella enterica]
MTLQDYTDRKWTPTTPDELAAWQASTVQKVAAAGANPIPVRLKDGELTPAPFKSAQRYAPHHPKWTHRDTLPHIIGVKLGAYILLDYDGDRGDAIPLNELETLLGLELGEPHQSRDNGSYHWLFKTPAHLKGVTLKQNAIGKLGRGVDVLTGNQLQYLKAGKTLLNDRYPALSELPDAPQAVIDVLTPEAEPEYTPNATSAAAAEETSNYGRWYIEVVEKAIADSLPGERLATLNKYALKVGRLVAGGEIRESDGVQALTAAALAIGLTPAEVKRSIKSALKKGARNPEKAPPLRRAQNQTFTSRAAGKPASGVIAPNVPPPGDAGTAVTPKPERGERIAQATGREPERTRETVEGLNVVDAVEVGSPEPGEIKNNQEAAALARKSPAFAAWLEANSEGIAPEYLPRIANAWGFMDRSGETVTAGPNVADPEPWLTRVSALQTRFHDWAIAHKQTLEQLQNYAQLSRQSVRELIAMTDEADQQAKEREKSTQEGEFLPNQDRQPSKSRFMDAAEAAYYAEMDSYNRAIEAELERGDVEPVFMDDIAPDKMPTPPADDVPASTDEDSRPISQAEREKISADADEHTPPGKPTLEELAEAAAVNRPHKGPEGEPEEIRTVSGEVITAESTNLPGRVTHHKDGMSSNGKASFLDSSPVDKIAPFPKWNGYTGDETRDMVRALAAEAGMQAMREIPPSIMLRHNPRGDVSGYKGLNHRDNLAWMLYKENQMVVRNLLTFDLEVFDRTRHKRLTASESLTVSDLVGLAEECKLPKTLVATHLYAEAENNVYHPLNYLFNGKEWDGIERVNRVFDCVPVKPEDVQHRNTLLRGVCLAAMTALINGRVSIKYVPVLFSEANDYHKTHFIRRLFDIMPGAFKEGVSIDPSHKDSVRKAVYCWGAELGELDSMTKKESGPLKAFIPMDEDEWRTEGVKTYIKKPRQTVYLGSINKPKFLKDPTMASRFPVISLTGPVKIDAVNDVLGWRMFKDGPQLVKPGELVQFWLEIRHMLEQGATHVLDKESLNEVKRRNDHFVDRGEMEQMIAEAIASYGMKRENGGNPFTERQNSAGEIGERFTAADVLRHFGMKGDDKGLMAKVGLSLSRMSTGTGAIIEKLPRGKLGQFYRVNWHEVDER